jgi:hypothetical protein
MILWQRSFKWNWTNKWLESKCILYPRLAGEGQNSIPGHNVPAEEMDEDLRRILEESRKNF